MALAVAVDFDLDAHRECVDNRDAHTVEATRNLVALAAELAAGVEHREHDLGRGQVFVLGVFADGDSTTIVANLAAAVRKQVDFDSARVTGHGLVDRVIDDLVDEVVQTGGASRTDVHAGTFPDGLEALENGDVLGAVGSSVCVCHGYLSGVYPATVS